MATKQKILIVDDDNNIAELVALYLTKECFDTQIVHDGEAALNLLSQFHPDLILLDLMLPGLSGEKVLAHAVKIPVIVVSAKEDYNNLLLQHFCWALYSSMGFPMIPDFC